MYKLDSLNDNSHLRKKISKWRLISLMLLLLILAVFSSRNNIAKDNKFINKGEYIARVKILGPIYSDNKLIKLINNLAKNKDVKGVIFQINSPGGTAAGGEAIFNAIRNLSKEKPTASHIHEIGASAAYMIAIATDKIFTYNTSLVGSIGVIAEIPEFKELLDKIGIKFNFVRSKPAKASPSYFEEMDEESRDRIRILVAENYQFFKEMVYARRNIKDEYKEKVVSGEIFTGMKAMDFGLIDEIGGEEKIVEWFKEEHKFSDPHVHTYYLKKKNKLDNLLKMSSNIINILNGFANKIKIYL